jgi:L-aspartate oxidase
VDTKPLRSIYRLKRKEIMYDYIIVGAGIAGLFASLHIPESAKTLILTKKAPWNSNSFLAQGGIAFARDESDIQKHIEDTKVAGSFYNNDEAVSILVKESLEIRNQLISMGLEFDKHNGKIAYTREGAHSSNRIAHIRGDATGRYLHSFILERVPHLIVENAIVVDILIQDDIAYGVVVYRDGKYQSIYAKNIVLASGGIGSLFSISTNDKTITGDILGIANRIGLPLKDLELLQFHPTAYITSSGVFLLTEALRGEGAHIVNSKGERFLFKYDKRGELASRDIVSQAIFEEGEAYLDISMFDKEFFADRFPTVAAILRKNGVSIPHEPIPISPALHYTIGGIETDLYGKVIGFRNLYAFGEVANLGVHGANRLASNSLLEALVFAKRGIMKSLDFDEFIFSFRKENIFKYPSAGLEDAGVIKDISDIAWNYLSVERNLKCLEIGYRKARELLNRKISIFVQNRVFALMAIFEAALKNRNSIGVHKIVERINC